MKNRKKTAPPALENTRWSGVPEENNVWKEYPRPAMARDSYWNLNGIWDYRISADSGIPPAYDGTNPRPFFPGKPSVRRKTPASSGRIPLVPAAPYPPR